MLRSIAYRLALLAASTLISAAPCARAQARFDFDATPGNLPKSVVPTRYTLALDLDPARDDFSGRAEIAITVRRRVDAVVLHARNLSATAATLRQGQRQQSLSVQPGEVAQTWSLSAAGGAPIAPGRYVLRIDYRGRVNNEGSGLFHADVPSAGQPRRMLATQFESIDARSVFPAFDEPAFRAEFAVSVRAPKGLTVLANMPEVSARADRGAVVHRFGLTPPMPSYLVALSVGRYDVLTARAGAVPLRIFTEPGKRAQAGYAMKATQQIVPFYGDYFGVPYALPRLDQLAVPSSLEGAMENWGLIMYSESTLLFDAAKSSPRTQRNVFDTVAHEIAHQWFGNLVTAASWDEIWLNEAFATWLASKATAHFNPEWQVPFADRLQLDRTMAGDAGGATRAIRSGPVSEAAAGDVFDNITYGKGGAVLGMLEQWLGTEAFRQGLGAYMRERRFSNATAGDLWFHMAAASQREVAAVAGSWTDQPGFPLVEVASACDGAGHTQVSLSQHRFSDGVAAAGNSGALWQIPVVLARGDTRATVLLSSAQQTIELAGCAPEPLVANAGGVGYYRVKYDSAGRDALARAFTRLAPADQISLLSDSFALAQAGEADKAGASGASGMADWLALVTQVPQVDGPARTSLFELAGKGFRFLDRAMAGTSTQAMVRAAGRRLFAPELARLGWSDRPTDDSETIKQRATLIELLARFDDAQVRAEAQARFDDDAAGRAPLGASIRAAVLRATGIDADRARFDLLLARLKSAGDDEDRWVYASALAAGRDPSRVPELLTAAMGGAVPPNIAVALPGMVGEASPNGALAYDFVIQHWDAMSKLAGNSMFGRPWLLPGTAGDFNDDARATQLLADQRRLAGEIGDQAAVRVAASIRLLAVVKQRDAAALETALRTAAGNR